LPNDHLLSFGNLTDSENLVLFGPDHGTYDKSEVGKERLMNQVKDVFTVKEAAKYLGVSRNWIYERINVKAGPDRIPHVKLGPGKTSVVRIRKADLDKYLADRLVTP
jgi:excisionase family DNA binding protein